MAYQFYTLCIAITVCAISCNAKPQGKFNMLDNAVLQELNDGFDNSIQFDQNQGQDPDKDDKDWDKPDIESTSDIPDLTEMCNDNGTNDIFPYPLHASCRVDWIFGVRCSEVSERLVNQIKLWEGPENCEQGGEKCLYKISSSCRILLRGTHTTPVAGYVDNFGFTFRPMLIGGKLGCASKSYSYSTVPSALLDYGTNYCNMFNLIDGSGLNKEQFFSESTCNKICTQYTDADCEVY